MALRTGLLYICGWRADSHRRQGQFPHSRGRPPQWVYRFLTGKVNKAIENGKPDLNLLFICIIPFQGMGKMMAV